MRSKKEIRESTPENQKKLGFFDVPKVLLQTIAELTKPKDVAALAQTCKAGSAIAESLTTGSVYRFAAIKRGYDYIASLREGDWPHEAFVSVNGYLAIGSLPPLIPPENVVSFGDEAFTILSDNGIIALREKLICPFEVMAMEPLDNPHHIGILASLLSVNGLTVLREKLITLQQALKFFDTNPDSLNALLSDDGLNALRRKSITLEQAGGMRSRALGTFLEIDGLKTKLASANEKNQKLSKEVAALKHELTSLKSKSTAINSSSSSLSLSQEMQTKADGNTKKRKLEKSSSTVERNSGGEVDHMECPHGPAKILKF